MQPRLHIAVVADDLTGAADTGVQFCPAVGPVYLTGLDHDTIHWAGAGTAGVSLYTNSRHVDAGTAGKRVGRAAEQLRKLAPGRVYKKIDSCLRGNLGAELDAMLEASPAKASFVAPAYPEQGRTTVNDIHKIDGLPVAETEIGRDPLSPVLESRLSRLLNEQSRLSVGHVGIDCIKGGESSICREVRKLLEQGACHIVFDSTENSHLDAIVGCALTCFKNDEILLAGSAGLAAGLVRSMEFAGLDTVRRAAAKRPRTGRWLFVCGSASSIMAVQAANLARGKDLPHAILEPAFLAGGPTGKEYRHCVDGLAQLWSGSSLILSIKSGRESSGHGENPEEIIAGMTGLVELLLGSSSPQGLFLSGGDTAERVLHEIGATGLLLHEEILPGLMLGRVAGGNFDGLSVVTKAGAFGDPEALVKLMNILNQR
jgi:uncharacterized protein YgbK (DUF1537 family)